MVTNMARAWGERLILPLARLLGKTGLTPNAVTVLGFLLTAAVALVLAQGALQLAGILLIVALGADGLDGSLARATGSTSRFGAFLDSTLDRWAEVLIFGALVYHFLAVGDNQAVMLATAAMASSLLVSYTRARAEGVGLTCKDGLLTRLERLIVLIVGLILGLVVPALWVIMLFATFTAVQRIWITWQADQVSR
jgi:CDP-diacylglycerol---glycerol-3-phosphate 3-phosphatidyltransferase